MGFLDKAKAAATDLAAKADSALQSAGAGGPRPADADRWLRDLGLLTYLEATGRPVDAAEQARVMAGLREIDAAGGLRSHALHTAPPPAPGMAPPPPGSASAPPPPPGASTPPPPPAASSPPPPPGATTPPTPGPGEPAAPDTPAPTTPGPASTPPPPPSWAGGDGTPRTP